MKAEKCLNESANKFWRGLEHCLFCIIVDMVVIYLVDSGFARPWKNTRYYSENQYKLYETLLQATRCTMNSMKRNRDTVVGYVLKT